MGEVRVNKEFTKLSLMKVQECWMLKLLYCYDYDDDDVCLDMMMGLLLKLESHCGIVQQGKTLHILNELLEELLQCLTFLKSGKMCGQVF